MARPKSTALGAIASAYHEIAVDLPNIAANTSADVEIAAPRKLRYDRPVLVQLKSGQAVVNTGLVVGVGRVVYNSGKKIQFRVTNATVGALDAASKTFQFLQL